MATCDTRILVLLIVAISAHVRGTCQLNESWRGSWFQSGFENIHINATSIDVKGRCLESEGNYFLFEDRADNCYRCLFIVQKHVNVLQYKESYCEAIDKLETLCSMIPGDAQQYSMFRRDAQPVECPFRGSFTYTYSRGHGECRSPVSRLDSCSESWRIFFRYQACPDVQGTESSEEQLDCLATWKDGSLRYLMGRLQHQSATSDEDRYRCFVYERTPSTGGVPLRDPHRPIFLLAQSGDATCSGLTSPTEGSRTLKLSKVEADGRRCRYPPWFLAHNHWQTLDGRWTYNLHKNSTLRIANTSGHTTSAASPLAGSPPQPPDSRHEQKAEQKAVCHSMVELAESTARVVAHMSQGCHTGYVCMVFYLRDGHVVELQAGDAAPAPEEACTPHYFNPVPGHYTTLIAASHDSKGISCPLEGKFIIGDQVAGPSSVHDRPCDTLTNDLSSMGASSFLQSDDLRHQTSTIASGCATPEKLDLYHDCSRDSAAGYLCRNTWSDHDNRTRYVIVTPHHRSNHDAPRRYCISLTSHSHLFHEPQTWQSQLEWIASSETCVRPYARDRLATHGLDSTHLSHNAHNLRPTPENSSAVAVFNVTSAGQCSGYEAAIQDSRKLYPSLSSGSPSSAHRVQSSMMWSWATVLPALAMIRRR